MSPNTDSSTSSLSDVRVALLVAPRGTEDPEFRTPREALAEAGAEVTVLSTETGSASTVNNDLDEGDSYEIDAAIDTASATDFDAVVIPGGTVGADRLRANVDVVDFVTAFADARKPIGAICHAPWVLVEAGLVDGRTLTSFPSLSTDIENAGGTWIDEEVVVDGGLITSRNPDDLPAFTDALITELTNAVKAVSPDA